MTQRFSRDVFWEQDDSPEHWEKLQRHNTSATNVCFPLVSLWENIEQKTPVCFFTWTFENMKWNLIYANLNTRSVGEPRMQQGHFTDELLFKLEH